MGLVLFITIASSKETDKEKKLELGSRHPSSGSLRRGRMTDTPDLWWRDQGGTVESQAGVG